VLILARQEPSWVLLNLSGQAVYHNDEIGADDAARACDWAHETVTALADTAPSQPANAIVGVRCYTFHERDGSIEARLSSGMAHYDGNGWVVVDADGEAIDRNDGISEEDSDSALAWAHKLLTERPGYQQPRSRWAVNVGVFPDGTYGDRYGVLGPQRMRRAWNRLLKWARVS
jgi:hypothetical protein